MKDPTRMTKRALAAELFEVSLSLSKANEDKTELLERMKNLENSHRAEYAARVKADNQVVNLERERARLLSDIADAQRRITEWTEAFESAARRNTAASNAVTALAKHIAEQAP